MVRPLHSSIYPTVHSPSTAQQSYPGALTNWPVARASFIPSPRWQGISNYAQMILPQELVQVPGWNPYTVSLFKHRNNRMHVCYIFCKSCSKSQVF